MPVTCRKRSPRCARIAIRCCTNLRRSAPVDVVHGAASRPASDIRLHPTHVPRLPRTARRSALRRRPAIVGRARSVRDPKSCSSATRRAGPPRRRSRATSGCPHPEGYRKALRKMHLAGKFGLPVVTFIDTPGAYPGIKARRTRPGRSHRDQPARDVPPSEPVGLGGDRRRRQRRRARASACATAR